MCSSQNDGGAIAAAATGLLPVPSSSISHYVTDVSPPDRIDRCSRTTAPNIILRIENFCNDD
jgi:hypothetical protein